MTTATQIKNGKVEYVKVNSNTQDVEVSWGVNPATGKPAYVICWFDWVEYATRFTRAMRQAQKMAKELNNN